MLVFKVMGGLGNQLFQYAFARRLSLLSGVPFRLDVTGFRKYKLHDYALHKFNIAENIAGPTELMRTKTWYFADKWLGFGAGRSVVEQGLGYDSSFVRKCAGGYFRGYWQSARYFEGIEDQLRREITLKEAMDAFGERTLEKMAAAANPVSLHVRRGDYVSDGETNRIHGLCSIEYYRAAVERVAEKSGDPTLFVFSDDIDWAKGNLDLGFPTVFMDSGGAAKKHQDLVLMSRCRNHIIANSTFSWWGAWLNANPEKVVVAPSRWFKTEQRDASTLVPEGWIRI